MEFTENDFKLLKHKIKPIRNYQYNCLDILSENIPEEYLYQYFLSNIEYKLKNIWNFIVLNWIIVHNKMEKNKKLISSGYFTQKYVHNHGNMTDETLNKSIADFVNEDPFKALFVVVCIQKYVNP